MCNANCNKFHIPGFCTNLIEKLDLFKITTATKGKKVTRHETGNNGERSAFVLALNFAGLIF
jgi:hypothetical protein